MAGLAYGSYSVQVLDAKTLASFVATPGSEGAQAATVVRHLGSLPEMLAMLAIASAVGMACGRRRGVLAALIVVAGANLTTQMLKVLFAHPRIRAILGVDHFAWDGFPSGHVTAAMSLAIAFAFVVPPRLRPLVAILGALGVAGVAWAVLALDVHYPSDVIGAVFVGGAWGFG
ncbi:MAG TPA: phosphatase PAP2 family protein, partial [Solirubrobacterales bacterium]|nr:phosphatase PAP2 family protein [Solirubrobacterales bacterium]